MMWLCSSQPRCCCSQHLVALGIRCSLPALPVWDSCVRGSLYGEFLGFCRIFEFGIPQSQHLVGKPNPPTKQSLYMAKARRRESFRIAGNRRTTKQYNCCQGGSFHYLRHMPLYWKTPKKPTPQVSAFPTGFPKAPGLFSWRPS